MNKPLYEFEHYKDFLNTSIEQMPAGGRGIKKKLALFLKCQGPFITQVLSGHLDFSPEHAFGVTQFLGLTQDETEYFLLLVSYNKTDNIVLKKFFKKSLEELRAKNNQIKNRMKMKETLDKEVEMIYYSSWHYAAIHMSLTIPEINSRESLANKFQLPLIKIDEVLHFLLKNNFIKKNLNQYEVTGHWLHLDKSSPMISKHHTNLRIQGINSLDDNKKTDLHYSAFFTCSKKDLSKLQELLLKTLSDFNEVVRPSKEEELACLNIDLFKI